MDFFNRLRGAAEAAPQKVCRIYTFTLTIFVNGLYTLVPFTVT